MLGILFADKKVTAQQILGQREILQNQFGVDIAGQKELGIMRRVGEGARICMWDLLFYFFFSLSFDSVDEHIVI